MNQHESRRLRGFWVLAAAAAALLWRLAAWRWPSSLISMPDGLRLPLALLGVWFVVCSVWAWWRRPGRFTGVFLLYSLGAGVHWGGAVGGVAELSLLLVYVAFSVLAEAALLHLALIYPRGGSLSRLRRAALYAPAALTFLIAPFTGLLPRTTLETVVGIVLMVANLLAAAAVVVFLIRLFREEPGPRRAACLPLVVATLVGANVVALIGESGALPGPPEAWHLVLGLIPLCLAIALASQRYEPSPAESGE